MMDHDVTVQCSVCGKQTTRLIDKQCLDCFNASRTPGLPTTQGVPPPDVRTRDPRRAPPQ
jgi:NMD protein affecting ribosome stability and mRNA decay